MTATILSLKDLIGETLDIQCQEIEMSFKNLNISIFKYYCNENRSAKKNVVIAIHGGPACCHNYMLPLQLLAREGYEVIFYDQAGCGKSSNVANPEVDAPWLLTLEYYIEELSEVIKYFSLSEFYLYGSSWGTMIAQEFAVLQPVGLLGIVLDGALCDTELYITTQWRDRISTLPIMTQLLMKKCIEMKDFSSPLYNELNEVMSKHFTCRLIPRPDCFTESLRLMNTKIYSSMQGDCEFMIGGILKNWTITDRLKNVECPALVLVGEFDTMTDECSQAVVDNIPLSWPLVKIKRAAHCKLCDEPTQCIKETVKFLKIIDSLSAKR